MEVDFDTSRAKAAQCLRDAVIEIMTGKTEPRREGKRDAPSAAPKGFPLNGKLPLSRVAARLLSAM